MVYLLKSYNENVRKEQLLCENKTFALCEIFVSGTNISNLKILPFFLFLMYHQLCCMFSPLFYIFVSYFIYFCFAFLSLLVPSINDHFPLFCLCHSLSSLRISFFSLPLCWRHNRSMYTRLSEYNYPEVEDGGRQMERD